jgi:hypothetical protein
MGELEIELEAVEVPDLGALGREIEEMPIQSRADLVRQGLARFNHARAPMAWAPLHAFLRDVEGRARGGLVGETWGRSRFVSQLWVEEALRSCGFAHLDTMSFQAPDSDRRLGRQVYGVLDGYADGHRRFYLRKSLA